MKTFKFNDGTKYQAQDFIQGIFINPKLPANFWTKPLGSRSENHMKHWDAIPFVWEQEGYYSVYCLDGGAWDRPTLRGGFDTQQGALDFVIAKYGC